MDFQLPRSISRGCHDRNKATCVIIIHDHPHPELIFHEFPLTFLEIFGKHPIINGHFFLIQKFQGDLQYALGLCHQQLFPRGPRDDWIMAGQFLSPKKNLPEGKSPLQEKDTFIVIWIDFMEVYSYLMRFYSDSLEY